MRYDKGKWGGFYGYKKLEPVLISQSPMGTYCSFCQNSDNIPYLVGIG